jgi:uncharacterized protein YijF (DUF1287 family)
VEGVIVFGGFSCEAFRLQKVVMNTMQRSISLYNFYYESYDLDTSKKKFWNPKKWFKRKNKATEDVTAPVDNVGNDVLRSRSTSELSIAEDQIRRRFVCL